MALVIKKTGKSEYGQYIKMFVYGQPGSGKTLFSSTAKDVIVGNIDGGLMTLHSRGVDYADIATPEDAHELLMHLRQPNHGYKTVVIDTLDELQKVFIAARLKKERKEQMALQDWGYLGEQMQKVLRAYRALPMNVIFLCHSSTDTDQDNGGLIERPLLQGAIKDQVAGFFDLVTYIQASTVKEGEEENVVRVLRFQPNPKYPILKDRSGKMPGFYKLNLQTDFDDIHELIYGNVDDIPDSVSTEVTTDVQQEETEEPPVAPPAKRVAKKVDKPVKADPDLAEQLKREAQSQTDPHGPATKAVKVVPAPEREDEEAAKKILSSVLDAKEVLSSTPKCVECEADVDENVAELSMIRHRKVLCRTHLKAAKTN